MYYLYSIEHGPKIEYDGQTQGDGNTCNMMLESDFKANNILLKLINCYAGNWSAYIIGATFYPI